MMVRAPQLSGEDPEKIETGCAGARVEECAMQNRNTRRSAIKNILSPLRAAAVALLLVVPLAWPAAGEAQEVSGEASAVRARLLGATTVLSDTGMLSDSSDAREASQPAFVGPAPGGPTWTPRSAPS